MHTLRYVIKKRKKKRDATLVAKLGNRSAGIRTVQEIPYLQETTFLRFAQGGGGEKRKEGRFVHSIDLRRGDPFP